MSIASFTPPATDENSIQTTLVRDQISPSKPATLIPTVALKPKADLVLQLADHAWCDKVPLPGQMAFNDAQTAFWAAHTPPKISPKVKKLIALRDIVVSQEKAGLHYEGRRSAAEAQSALLREQAVESSQAATLQNPLRFLSDSIHNLKNGIATYFSSTPNTAALINQFSEPIGAAQFNVRASTALSKRETDGEDISSFGVLLVDSGHVSIGFQNAISAFLGKHFKPERGDIFLTEALFVFESKDGKEVTRLAKLEDHHASFCLGVPLEFCEFFNEPEAQVADMAAVMSERRTLVKSAFEFLMNAIPPAKAREARQRLEKYNSQIHAPDTEFRVKLMIEYQDYCDRFKQFRWSRHVDALTDAIAKEMSAIAKAANARDRAYNEKLIRSLKQLKPGARLFYSMGKDHYDRLVAKIDRLNTFIVDTDVSKEKDDL